MLVWGTINPPGEIDSYNGLYFTRSDIQQLVQNNELVGTPLKIEHKGVAIGKVASAWVNNNGALDCILDVNENVFEGAVCSNFIENSQCTELSIGYTVDVRNSQSGQPIHYNKKVVEVSIVRKGARDACYIHGYSRSQ